jgi:hypothetical protein
MTKTWKASSRSAMATNSIGLAGRPFPVWVHVEVRDDVVSVGLGPVTGAELLGALALPADQRLLLFDTAIGSVDCSSGVARSLTLADCMADVTTDFEAFGPDELAASAAAVADMLGDTYLYDYALTDLPDTCDPVDVWAALSGHNWVESPALARSGGEFYASVHDDCYACLEVRDPRTARRVIGGLLAIAMSNAAMVDGEWPEAIAPDEQIIDELLGEVGAFVLDTGAAEVRPGDIVVRFVRQRWKLGVTVDACDGFLRDDRVTGRYDVLDTRPDAVMRVHAAFTITQRGTCVAGTLDYGACHHRNTVAWIRSGARRTATCRSVEIVSAGATGYVGLMIGDVDPGEFAQGDVVIICRPAS